MLFFRNPHKCSKITKLFFRVKKRYVVWNLMKLILKCMKFGGNFWRKTSQEIVDNFTLNLWEFLKFQRKSTTALKIITYFWFLFCRNHPHLTKWTAIRRTNKPFFFTNPFPLTVYDFVLFRARLIFYPFSIRLIPFCKHFVTVINNEIATVPFIKSLLYDYYKTYTKSYFKTLRVIVLYRVLRTQRKMWFCIIDQKRDFRL